MRINLVALSHTFARRETHTQCTLLALFVYYLQQEFKKDVLLHMVQICGVLNFSSIFLYIILRNSYKQKIKIIY